MKKVNGRVVSTKMILHLSTFFSKGTLKNYVNLGEGGVWFGEPVVKRYEGEQGSMKPNLAF